MDFPFTHLPIHSEEGLDGLRDPVNSPHKQDRGQPKDLTTFHQFIPIYFAFFSDFSGSLMDFPFNHLPIHSE
jgi:hypothetical protein